MNCYIFSDTFHGYPIDFCMVFTFGVIFCLTSRPSLGLSKNSFLIFTSVSLLLLLSPLQKFSSYRNPHDYKAGVFKGSVLITLLSESIPSPQDRNHTLTTPYLYLWLDLPLEPMYPIAVDTWVYHSTTSPKELNIFSPLLLICCSSWTPWLSYWC